MMGGGEVGQESRMSGIAGMAKWIHGMSIIVV